jgi:hypothetical protein
VETCHVDLAGHLIAEATAAGVVTREYVWLDDMPLAPPRRTSGTSTPIISTARSG